MRSLTKRGLYTICALALVSMLLGGCPPDEPPEIDGTEKVKAGSVKQKLERLEVLYEIIEKDNPPPNDTYEFRQKLLAAEKALKKGSKQEAARLVDEAWTWIEGARDKYYRQHQSAVASGTSRESGADLMASARGFARTGAARQQDGYEWEAKQYYQAAIEQGELAIIGAGRTPEQAFELMELSRQMTAIYESVGAAEEAKQSKEKVVQKLIGHINALEKSVRTCAKEQAPACRPYLLMDDPENYKARVKEMRGKSELQLSIVAEASQFAPGRFRSLDYSRNIDAFERKWAAKHDPYLTRPDPNNGKPPEEKGDPPWIKEVKDHDKLKKGAIAAKGSGITLIKTGILVHGDKISVKGMLANYKTVPIYNPRVTLVGGGVMSDVKNLGYPKMNPNIKTTFTLTLKYYTKQAFQNSSSLPAHELLLIYNDQNGKEIKILQPVR